jgi:hypothetical protein
MEDSRHPNRHNTHTPIVLTTMNNSLYRYKGPPDKPVVCKSLPPVAIVPNPGLTWVIDSIVQIPSPPNTFRCSGQVCVALPWLGPMTVLTLHTSGGTFDPNGNIVNNTCQLLTVQMVGLPQIIEVAAWFQNRVQAAAYVRTPTKSG